MKTTPIPDGYSKDDIRLESSTCTGEKTIGFYDKHDRKLHCSELVRTERDIKAFYAKYGLVYDKTKAG
ncbi:MAG: hypothetical protein J6O50_10770 [Ruminiclostridium sp.]|nr:hypothetical protein [Ruminiclostridium sp.]